MGQYAFLNGILSLVGTGDVTTGKAVAVSIVPDPHTVPGVMSTVTRLTGYVKGVRFVDDQLAQLQPGESLFQWLTASSNSPILGPAAVSNLTAAMPAAPLAGGAQPPDHVDITGAGTSLLNDSSLTATPHGDTASAPPSVLPNLPAPVGVDAQNLLSGVPGLIGQLEQIVEQLAPTIKITWKVIYRVSGADPEPTDAEWTAAPAAVDASNNPLSAVAINIAVPIIFSDDAPPAAAATGSGGPRHLHVRADIALIPPGQTVVSDTISVTLSLPIVPVQLPCFAAIFTWKVYGTTSYPGNTSADDNAVLIVLPANSPLPITTVAPPNGLLAPVQNVVDALDAAEALVGALPPACVLPQPVSAVVGEVTATNRILNLVAGILNAVGHGDYHPVVITKCAAPPPTPSGSKQPTIDTNRGAIQALQDLYFDTEAGGHDNFYDHPICLLVVGAPGTRITFWNDEHFNVDTGNLVQGDNSPGSSDPHGMLTLQTGSWGLLGMPDMGTWGFEPASQTPADAAEPGCSTALNYCGFAPTDLPTRIRRSWRLDNIHSLAFTVTPAPRVTAVNPGSGSPSDHVTLEGSGLAGIVAVTFGDVPAQIVSLDSEDSVTVQVPAGTSGQTVDVAVSTVVGNTTLTQGFRYS